VKLLIENEANVHAKTRDGLIPLHCATRSGNLKVANALIQAKSDISAITKNGLSPLHMAAQESAQN
jgi:ankyrin